MKGKLLAVLQLARSEGGEGAIEGPVMKADELRTALTDSLGEELPSKSLFSLMQQADPESEGVIKLGAFLEVVAFAKEKLETERRQRQLMAAYQSLGGTMDKDKKIKSDLLMQVTGDFVGVAAAKEAMQGVVKHKMKAVQEVLAMGGALDSDEEEELKDTAQLEFDELEAFGVSLKEAAEKVGVSGGEDDDDSIGEGGPAACLR